MKKIIIGILQLCVINASVAQILAEKTNEIHLSFANQQSLTTGPLPKIKWVNPILDYISTEKNNLNVEAQIDLFEAIDKIDVTISNGTDGVVIATKKIAFNPNDKKIIINQKVVLQNGPNVISIDVKTRDGVVLSDKRTLIVGAGIENNLLSLDRKDYALLFATDKYDHWDDLVNPVDDSQAVAEELKNKYGFVTEVVENPTVEEVWEKLREYSERKFNPQDQLMIFFAGHGHFDESFGEGFVVAKNSLANDLSRTTYISHNRLRGVVGNIPCRHTLLMMDVCFGGTLDPVIARSRGKENLVTRNELVIRKLGPQTRKYITSGGKEYVSDGVPGKHSPFAECVIESLKSWGGDDRVLTLAEMQTYMEKLKQQPRVGSFGEDEALSDFVFIGRK